MYNFPTPTFARSLKFSLAFAILVAMKFKSYYATLNEEQKKVLARRLQTSPAYLYQLSTGHRFAGLKLIRAINHASDGAVEFYEMPLKPPPKGLEVLF